MITKTLEIHDDGTFIPALAICLEPSCKEDGYLLARAGYGRSIEDQRGYIVIVKLCGGDVGATSDPFQWNSGRTMRIAHQYIEEHFHELKTGAVVDVEFIEGETKEPKRSEAHLYA